MARSGLRVLRRSLARVKDWLLLGVMVAAVVFLVLQSVQGWMHQDDPREWGTFTRREQVCERTDRLQKHCFSVGDWVGDDGSQRIQDVKLKGHVRADGTVRAARESVPAAPQGVRPRVVTQDELTKTPWLMVILAPGVAYLAWLYWLMMQEDRSETT